MNFLLEHWYLIVAGAAVLAAAGFGLICFLTQPRYKQLDALREWLLWAVSKAEKELGSGTGKLKLRYVYDMAISRFSWLGKLVTFGLFSSMVDDALAEMRGLLESNEAIQEYVNGETEVCES